MLQINYHQDITKAPIPRQLRKNGIIKRRRPKKQRMRAAIKHYQSIIRELNNRSFFHFFQYFWPQVSSETLVLNWHIEYLCDLLQETALRVINNKPKRHDIIINIPPGTTKTTIVSIMFPVWCWTIQHKLKFITASYSGQLALESAETSRDLIRSTAFEDIYPDLYIKLDKDTKSNYKIVRKTHGVNRRTFWPSIGGNRYSTSVGGTLTGFHGHILIVDDPLNPEQAVSEKELKKANRWISQTLSTRKVNKRTTVTILIMQRLHENDPTGFLLDRNKGRIKHICLPGEIINYKDKVKPKRLVKNYVNNVLDPIRMPIEVLEEMKDNLGQYGYAGQVGQSPTPPGGGMFKVDRFSIIDTLPAEVNWIQIVRYWDKAATNSKENPDAAFTVGVKMLKYRRVAQNHDSYIIMDVKRGQWSSEEREEIIRITAIADGRLVNIYIEQEPGSGGKESAQNTIKGLAGFSVYADRPTGDKVYRADPYSVQVNNGNIYLLRGNWNTDFIEEHRHFPFSTYKDQVDAAAGAFNKLVGKKEAKVY